MNKLEKALAELDTLLEEVHTLRKEEEPTEELEAAKPHPLDEKMEDEMMDVEEESMEYMDDEGIKGI